MEELDPQRIAEGKALVTVVACLLEKLVDEFAESGDGDSHVEDIVAEQDSDSEVEAFGNEQDSDSEVEDIEAFASSRRPKIGLDAYLQNLCEETRCSEECLVLALIYADRFIAYRGFMVTPQNVHHIYLTSLMTASKYLDDCHFDNAWYAQVGGLTLREINSLERMFLFSLGFDLGVAYEEFLAYKQGLSDYGNCLKCGDAPGMLAQDDRMLSDSEGPEDHRGSGLTLLKPAAVLGNLGLLTPAAVLGNAAESGDVEVDSGLGWEGFPSNFIFPKYPESSMFPAFDGLARGEESSGVGRAQRWAAVEGAASAGRAQGTRAGWSLDAAREIWSK